MVLELENMFSATAGDAITATAFAPNWVDGGAVRDVAAGKSVFGWWRVVAAFNTLTSLQVDIGGADDGVGTNFVSYGNSGAIALASLTANSLQPRIFLTPGKTKKQFLVAKYTVAGANPTLGSVKVGLQYEEGFPQNGAINI